MAEELLKLIRAPTAGPVGVKQILVILVQVLTWPEILITIQCTGVAAITTQVVSM
jgi:hypothetical protein